MKKTAIKNKNKRRAKRRMLILIATLISLITAVLLLIVLEEDNNAANKRPAYKTNNTISNTQDQSPILPVESIEGTAQMLFSSTWQDKYDPNYMLRFDDSLSSATETNSFSGTSRTFSVSSSDESYYLVEGQSRYQLMIVDGTLCLDYGDPVGVVEYILVPGEGS